MGEHRPEEGAKVVRQSLLLGTLAGVVTGAPFALTARPLLVLLGADGAVADAGAPYLTASGA